MYDAHLHDFLQAWLPDGRFSVDLERHLALTDLEVLAAMRASQSNPEAPGFEAARRILTRGHFRRVFDRAPSDLSITLEPGAAIAAALATKYDDANVKTKKYAPGSGGVEFPVKVHDGSVVSSTSLSAALRGLPKIVVDQVFVEPSLAKEARTWLASNKRLVLEAAAVDEGAEE
jgi:hypothetical protein